jgi:hypothetical protein
MTSSIKMHELIGQLVASFRDETKKEELLAIVSSDEQTLENLVKAAASNLLIADYKLDYPGESDAEKETGLYQELKSLFGDTIEDEIKIQEKVMGFNNAFFDMLLKTPRIKMPEKQRALFNDFEGDLVEILRTVPEYYFFDFIENLMDIKKVLSVSEKPRAKDGDQPGSETEILSFSAFRNALIGFLRVHKLKDLELLYQPIRKMTEIVYHQAVEVLPISKRGLDAFLAANSMKNEVLRIFKESREANESLDEIEKKIQGVIYDQLKSAAEKSSNDIMYFLENLLGIGFDKVVEMLGNAGIKDLILFASALTMDYTMLEYRFNEKGVEQADIDRLLLYEGNMAEMVKLSLDDCKRGQKECGVPQEVLEATTVDSAVTDYMSGVENPALDFIAQDLHLDNKELVDLLLLEVSMKEICKDLGIKSMDQLVMLLRMKVFIGTVSREVFLSMLGRLTKQIARIIEFFTMLDDVKAGLAGTVAYAALASRRPPWEVIKEQGSAIERIMSLQDNVAYILNTNDPVDVNAFIHGKLSSMTFKDALQDMRKGNSPIYCGVVDHPIVLDELDVVSQISALDLYLRWQEKLRSNP